MTVGTSDIWQTASRPVLHDRLAVALALADHALLLQGIDNCSVIHVVVNQKNQNIVYHSENLEDLFAQVNAGPIPVGFSDLLSVAARDTCQDIIEDMLGQDFLPDQSASSPVPITLFGLPFEAACTHCDIPGNGRFFAWAFRNITGRLAQQSVQDELISMVSHELRSPLASIRGALKLIGSGALGELPDEARKVFEIAARNSEHMLSMVNEILADQKESHENGDKYSVIDLSQLLDDAIDLNTGFASQWGTTFRRGVVGTSARVRGDRQKLTQVLTNLITNAVKFSPSNSEISLNIRDMGKMWRVEVTDSGPGVPPEQRAKLFQRFTSKDTAAEPKLQSSGLGLNIARQIMVDHGGAIDLRNNPDKGATFFFDLKKCQDQDQAIASQEQPDKEDHR